MKLKNVMRFEGGGTQGLKDLCIAIDERIGGKITLVEIGSFMGKVQKYLQKSSLMLKYFV